VGVSGAAAARQRACAAAPRQYARRQSGPGRRKCPGAAGEPVSRRIGHASVSTTLNIYAHRFAKTDAGAADAIEAALKR